MLIVSQNEDKITETLELDIQEIKTCKNIFIDNETWKKFKKITRKKYNQINLEELIDLGEFLEQDITKSVYQIVEIKRNRSLGIYQTKDKAKNVLKEIMQKYSKQEIYQLPKDRNEIVLL